MCLSRSARPPDQPAATRSSLWAPDSYCEVIAKAIEASFRRLAGSDGSRVTQRIATVPVAIAAEDVGTLYLSCGDWLRGWLLRHTRCPQRAEDLAQDTFCRVLERRTATPLRDGRSYLATIARRLIIDQARRTRVEAAFLDAHRALVEGVAEPGPDRIVEAIADLLIVTQALETLPAAPRRAYLMARLDGLGHAEIADVLGVSKSMVKQYIARAYAHCYAATYGQP
jgi:RNA polymerase sigma-70 factor (ECF subfamily)